jgi:hypothetical protein
VPEDVLAKVNSIAGDDFKVACVKKIPVGEFGKAAWPTSAVTFGPPEFSAV